MGPRPTGRRLPTWGVSSCPTMVGVFVQLQGAYATSQQKTLQWFIVFYNTNHTLASFIQKSFSIGLQRLRKGLPSINMLKGQTGQQICVSCS